MFKTNRAEFVASPRGRGRKERPYSPPTNVRQITLADLLGGVRPIPENQQPRLGISDETEEGMPLWVAGDMSLVRKPCVAVVGARKVSLEGAARARRIGRELSKAGVVVVSGLAYGVDTEALTSSIETGGRVIAVIGQ